MDKMYRLLVFTTSSLIATYILNTIILLPASVHADMLGRASRMIRYDRALNERNAIPALNIMDAALSWYRLDDGVMGGQSETTHTCSEDNAALEFRGQINTTGGGFTSIRSKVPNGLPADTIALRLKVKADGKTYKLIVNDGVKSMMGGISWQADIPTETGGTEQTVTVLLSDLKPTAAGRPRQINAEDVEPLLAPDMKEIGIMLSLSLSDGSPNPKETFGEGIFPFSLTVLSIEPISSLDS